MIARAKVWLVDDGLGRLGARLLVVLVLASLVGDAGRQPGSTSLRAAVLVVMMAIVGAGWWFRSSLATASGLVGLTMIWALSQREESATGAVFVGAALTVVAVVISWLAEPPVSVKAEGIVARAVTLVAIVAGAAAVGLLTLQFVDRPPASRMVVLLGVVAVVGALGIVYSFGEVDDTTSDR